HHDPSLLFCTNGSDQVRNGMGTGGAYVASFLLYLFGGAAFFFIPSVVCSGLFLLQRKQLSVFWEKFFALYALPFFGAPLLAVYHIDLYGIFFPGGFFGQLLCNLFLHYFDILCVTLLITIIVALLVFILVYPGLIFLVHLFVQTFSGAYAVIYRYRVI